jgi:hypothetical protein
MARYAFGPRPSLSKETYLGGLGIFSRGRRRKYLAIMPDPTGPIRLNIRFDPIVLQKSKVAGLNFREKSETRSNRRFV